MTVNHTLVTRICADCKQSYPYKEIHVCTAAKTAPASIIKKPEDELLGALLGDRYRIESFLSRGGMGTVYLSRHVVLDKLVAIKVLNDIKDEVAQARFLLEAKAACAVNHEHIVNITDFGVLADGRPYLVMEYLQGQSLDALIAKGPLMPMRVCRIGEQIAFGLQAVHDKGILHRDLKPGNIYLMERHRRDYVKILDFGIAKVVTDKPKEKGEDGLPFRPTQEGMVLGTAEYLAPEQALGEPLDARADQFSLGCILYEMLTGEVPFKGNNAMSTVVKRLSEDPVPPRQRRPELQIPESLEAVTKKAMSRDREKRFGSMSELGLALGRELEALGGVTGDSSGSISAAILAPMFSPSTAALPSSAVTLPTQIDRPTRMLMMKAALLPRRFRLAVALGVAMAILGLSLGLFLGMGYWQSWTKKRQPITPPVVVEKTELTPQKIEEVKVTPSPVVVEEPDKTPTTPTPNEVIEPKNPVVTNNEVDDGALRLTFENAGTIAVTISCVRQRACTMAPQKQCLFRIGNEPGRCEATAPGHKAQTYLFRELRSRARGGRLKERVILDAKGLGEIKL